MKCKCKEQRIVRVRRNIFDRILGIKEKYKCANCNAAFKIKG
jgi:predicted SprT family Zn-dependent metalloprotease